MLDAVADGGDAAGGCLNIPKIMQTRKDGSVFHANLHACPISHGGRPAIIVSTTDVAEMMDKDAQIIQAAKVKSPGEMSAGVGHELNQPLNAIRMGSDFLALVTEQGPPAAQSRLHEVARDICARVDRATEIINTLRSFGRKSDAIIEPLDVNRSARDAILERARKDRGLRGVIALSTRSGGNAVVATVAETASAPTWC